ncbi:hypothetical protein vseg_009769 [Gypsophila vaccaria]
MIPHYPPPPPNFPPISLNPNPNPNFRHPQFNFPPPPQLPPPPQVQSPIQDIPNSIASLKTLIQSSNSTLESLNSLIPSLSTPSNPLIQCNSNPNHWVPPSSLFLHSLSCPSPLEIGPIVDNLQYPHTLRSDNVLNLENRFVQCVDHPTFDLCFSIDDHVGLGVRNFFYNDCPGVVSSSNDDASSCSRMFSLPHVLSVECGDFVSRSDNERVEYEWGSVKVLPSEVWFVGVEIGDWTAFPSEYSLSVCRAFLRVECVGEGELLGWVIENSPRFGVVIDVPMRDHLCVLVRVCLKAVVKEAVCSYGSFLQSRVDGEIQNCNQSFVKCPVLVDVLRWLTSQLSILYGEMNSRSLVIAMLRHLLNKAASNASIFPLDEKVTESYGNDSTNILMLRRPTYVYQIAAAIAALHERAALEERIRALRNPLQTPYQRSTQHAVFSKKADEERCKRPDYRALIEHDSLLNQSQHDQACNKPKTKEELLAEERDYKRRRMSYRGKKSKRAPKEVMRDIIEEYMEAIKHTGSIGSPAKEEMEGSVLTSIYASAPATNSSKLNRGSMTDVLDDYRTPLDDDYNYRHTKSSHRYEQHKKESYSHEHSDDRRTSSRDRRHRDFDSRSPSKDRRRSQSRERRSHSRNHVSESERSKSNNSSSRRSSHHDYKFQNSTSRSLRNSSGRKDKRKIDSPDRQRWQPQNDESFEINDRYDPSETRHTSDDQLDYRN